MDMRRGGHFCNITCESVLSERKIMRALKLNVKEYVKYLILKSSSITYHCCNLYPSV